MMTWQRTVLVVCVTISLLSLAALGAQTRTSAPTPAPNQQGRYQYHKGDVNNYVFDTQTGMLYVQVTMEKNQAVVAIDLIGAKISRSIIPPIQ